jgi:transcriptional regulator with XRE-family HTH domain
MTKDTLRISESALKGRMKHRLEELRWTMEELSEKTGESYSNIRNWVTGKTRVPATFLTKFADTVPVNPTWLLTGSGAPSPIAEGTGELLFQLLARIAEMATRSDATTDELHAHLAEMIGLLEVPDCD